jgi:hypothetical protein
MPIRFIEVHYTETNFECVTCRATADYAPTVLAVIMSFVCNFCDTIYCRIFPLTGTLKLIQNGIEVSMLSPSF